MIYLAIRTNISNTKTAAVYTTCTQEPGLRQHKVYVKGIKKTVTTIQKYTDIPFNLALYFNLVQFINLIETKVHICK